MAKFTYSARAANGQVLNGQLEALDEGEARVKLKARNLNPLRVVVTSSGAARQLKAGPKVNSRDLQIFTRQLSTLINAGIPIVDSLRMLGEGRKNPILSDVANRVRASIEGGRRLAESLGNYPGVFDRLYVNLVHAGEEAGILDGILSRLAAYLEKSEKIKKQVKGALVYPIAILAVSVLVVTGILVFIIPKFQDLYASSGKQLPGLTRMVIAMSQFIIKKWMIIFGVIGGGGYLFSQYAKSPEGQDELDRVLIRAPIFGDLVLKASLARISRTLSTLLTAGVGVIDALDIAARTAGNKVMEDTLIRAKEAVTTGRPLAGTFAKESIIPEMVTQMVAIGEKSGTMDAMFGKVADFYEDDVENVVKGITTLIEPVLMVFLGGTVAVLVLAMYLPIFDMASLGSG